ncbi:CPBP family intramembrane glutamic endopeptidase [Paenactinomyces guangxiensis]|uniref:CPBP family intramembrane metalloprotease n=1 Tax=Paenactinomyces guangxiensis TaxID=1490290 RepID=A0A7W1WR92_9BACL|nr:CPBP family intramembrane glutamic endopeptidase [Paenactinomyces guangxiensis]MBA4494620.1 CPBP family intramembrane metalloprotease [Paenactinomyces guangxiensis]MBH8591617.1 CPBP family intramembrane metalloprotease [Paenactinomyces guangxiensis]
MNKQKNLRIVFFFTGLGIIAAFAVIPYQLNLVGMDSGKNPPLPLPLLYWMLALQTGAMVFVGSFIGLKMAARVGLSTPILSKWLYQRHKPSFSTSWLCFSFLGGALGALLIVLIDKFIFVPHISQLAKVEPSPWWSGLLTMLYGGIVEEVLARLFVMTLFVWLLAQITGKERGNIPAGFFWLGIFAAALLFGSLHLPTTEQAFGELTPLIVTRGLLMNGLLGIYFGYLYWKKGLEYAIIAHISADLFLHAVFPNVFSS